MKFGIGQPLKRVEDERLLTGNGVYTDDINLQNQAYMYIIRSPYSNAYIKHIDVSEAKKVEGVIKIITHKEIDELNINKMRTTFLLKNRDGSDMVETQRHILAKNNVRFVGDPIIAIVAANLNIAEEAADKVFIDYEEKNSVTDLKEAIKEESPIVRNELNNNICFDWELGEKLETLKKLKESKYIIDIELRNNRLVPNPMECRSTLGIYNKEEDNFLLYCSSQGVHSLKKKLAKIFNKKLESFNVITKDVGGGFGMKIFNYPEYVLTLAASKLTNKPVKWKASRTESFLSDIHGRDHLSKATMGLNEAYQITGLKVETLANIGAYISDFAIFIPTYAGTGMLTGCYHIPSAYANVKGLYTNTNPTDAYRGAGRPEAAYLIERLINKAAKQIGISEVEIRNINLITKESMPYTTALGHTYDSGDFKNNLKQALNYADYFNFEKRKQLSKQNNKYRGIGISTYIEACGGGGPEFSSISIGKNGNIIAKIGTQSNGQGHETAYAQIIADVLKIPIGQIEIKQGNSTEIERGSGTGGSRSIPVGGSAFFKSSKNLIDKAKHILSNNFNIELEEISYENGSFSILEKSYSFSDLVKIAGQINEKVEVNDEWAPSTGSFTYPNGTHICELEIDRFTGKTYILNYTVVDDFGKVINPLLLEGQVHGGVAQGIGQALYEETIYDKDTGQLLSGSLMDYALPRASDLSNFQFFYNQVPCANNLLGVKGAGEAGAIGAPPAVMNAICNALDKSHVEMPAKPERLWRIINELEEKVIL